MYEEIKHSQNGDIEISCNGSRPQIIYLQTSSNDDKMYFIKKLANVCNESILILSDNDSFDNFRDSNWDRPIGGLLNLSVYDDGVENFVSIYERKPFQIYINIETLSDDDLLRLLSNIYYQGKRGNSICLIIHDLNSILKRLGLKNNRQTNQNLANTFSYNSTLVCDGKPIEKDLYSRITHITIVQHKHGQLYDVIYENNSETLENRTLEGIKLIGR